MGSRSLAGVLFAGACAVQAAPAAGPSFDCAKVVDGSIARMVCNDSALAALDRQLAAVYGQATQRATNERPPTLKAEQRGWVKGRDECWKDVDKYSCVEQTYTRRIAELQARYRLVETRGPFSFACGGDARNELVVNFFATEPPTLIAERGDAVSLMFLQPSGSGSRYVGRNESFWEHQGEATLVWGYGGPQMRCSRKP